MLTVSLNGYAGFPQPRSQAFATAWGSFRPSPLLVALVACALLVATLPLASRLSSVSWTPTAQPAGLQALPPAAQGAISTALGRDAAAYAVTAGPDGLAGTNPRHDLTARFTADGVRVAAGTEALGLSLRALGYGEALQPVLSAIPTADVNRVSYQRGALTEWYANGPLGLEQGFTLRTPPARTDTGDLTVALALTGDFRPTLATDRRSLDLAGTSESLRYAGLFAVDAEGRDLPAAIELRAGEILLRVDDAGARYPLTIDPFVQRAKLTASDGAAGDNFGYSASIAGDTIVVGAYGDDANRGAAYVFVKPDSGWATAMQTAKLTASDGADGDEFGWSVAISGDTIVVGASGDDVPRYDEGSAYVFVPDGGWATGTETAKLTASDGAPADQFGRSVAISGDTIVVGAWADDVGADPNENQGSAYVFTSADGWATGRETAKLTSSDRMEGASFGSSVAISGDTIVVGAQYDDIESNKDQGSAWVFVKPEWGWSTRWENARLTASDGDDDDQFGNSVAIDGDTIVVGALASGFREGAAYVFLRSAAGVWPTGTETAKLTASDFDSGGFGSSVAISRDTIVVGAYLSTGGSNFDRPNQGSAYVFAKPADGWATGTETEEVTASDGAAHDFFAYSVAISGDTVVAGAPATIREGAGSAYVFANEAPPPAAPTVSIGNASGAEGHAGTKDLTFTVSRSGDTSGASSVSYTVDDGTATAGSDYVDESGSVSFAAEDTSKEITVAVIGDTTDEPDETFTVTLSNASNATIAEAAGKGTGTIENDDDPAISIGDTSGAEGHVGTSELTFTVSRSGDTTGASSVAYVVDDGTATAGSDYVDESGTVTFAANDTSKTITVAVNGDTTDEPDETLTVRLSNASNAKLSDASATGTITDDDPGPTFSIGDRSVAEDAGTVTFTVTKSGLTVNTATVDYASAAHSGGANPASAGSDYTATSGSLSFGPTEAEKTFTVAITNDTTDEPDETFLVKLSNASNATISDGDATGTIEDDDKPPAEEFDFSWREPTDAQPALNYARAGQVVRVRFSLNGDFGLDVLAQGSPQHQRYDCRTGEAVPGTLWHARPFGEAGLSYDAESDTYTYTWQSTRNLRYTCRQFVLTLSDGSVQPANFRFLLDYRFRFVSPTAAPPAQNEVSTGEVVPVTFELGGNWGLWVHEQGWPKTRRVDCGSGEPIGTRVLTRPYGTDGLSYDGNSDRYTYSWQTRAAWAGTCRRWEIRLSDGRYRYAVYRFTQGAPVTTASP